jgi:hypothetical protein
MDRVDAERPRPTDGLRRLRIILTALVFCRGIVLLCILPPFEGWDEYQHVAYVVHLNETGERPWLAQSNVPASLLDKLAGFPHCNSALRQIGSVPGVLDYTGFWEREGQRPPTTSQTPAKIGLYQAQHGPLYYALVGPLFAALGGVDDLRRSIGGLRFANLLMTTAAVWVALGVVAGLVRDRRLAACCGLLIATQPLFLINGVRVANDALGVLLATLSIAWALRTPRRFPVAHSLGLGMLVGLAVLAKSVNFGVVPFVGVCWLWTSWKAVASGWIPARLRSVSPLCKGGVRRGGLGATYYDVCVGSRPGEQELKPPSQQALRPSFMARGPAETTPPGPPFARGGRSAVIAGALRALALVFGFLLITGPEFLSNWAHFGSITVMQESILNRQAGHGFGDLVHTARSIDWPGFLRKLWLRKNLMSGGWSWAGDNQRMPVRHEVLAVISLLGWGWILSSTWRRRNGARFFSPITPLLCLAICGGYSASLGYHAVQSELCWGTMSTNPWYAAAAYPWFLLLVTAGAMAWPFGRFRFVLPLLFAFVFLETESTVVLGSMTARYTTLAEWGEALRRLATLQRPLLGTTTLYVAIGGVLLLASLAIREVLKQAFEPAERGYTPTAVAGVHSLLSARAMK